MTWGWGWTGCVVPGTDTTGATYEGVAIGVVTTTGIGAEETTTGVGVETTTDDGVTKGAEDEDGADGVTLDDAGAIETGKGSVMLAGGAVEDMDG